MSAAPTGHGGLLHAGFSESMVNSLRQGLANQGDTVLEKAMARAFKAQPEQTSFRRAVLPLIVLNDGILGILIPGGDERAFEFQIDGAVSCTSQVGHRNSIYSA